MKVIVIEIKGLSIKENLEEIKPYLIDIINNPEKSDKMENSFSNSN